MIGFIARIWKQWWCKHDFQFVRNIHGEEIIFSSWHRSIWKCPKCLKRETRPQLHTIIESMQKSVDPLAELNVELEKIVSNPPALIGMTGLTLDCAIDYLNQMNQLRFRLEMERASLLDGYGVGPPGARLYGNVQQVLSSMQKVGEAITTLRVDIAAIRARRAKTPEEIFEEKQREDSEVAYQIIDIARKFDLK